MDLLREYNAALEDALAVIRRGVELMTVEQLGQWRGVRAFQEQAGALLDDDEYQYTEERER